MTYKEAKQIIDDNARLLDKYSMRLNPPHRILGCFISPKERSMNREQYIFTRCVDEDRSKDNN